MPTMIRSWPLNAEQDRLRKSLSPDDDADPDVWRWVQDCVNPWLHLERRPSGLGRYYVEYNYDCQHTITSQDITKMEELAVRTAEDEHVAAVRAFFSWVRETFPA